MSSPTETHSSGCEASDASPRIALLTAAVLALGVALSLLVAAGFFLRHHRPAVGEDPVAPRTSSFREGPSQRTSIQADWTQLQADTRPKLENYGWIDRTNGVVRIPITRAMELMATESPANAKGGSAP